MRGLFSELQRRNVFRVAALYLVVAWLVLQVTDVFMDLLPLPQWTAHLILLLLLIGFPIALVLAWAFELTPEGIRPEKQVPAEQSTARITGRRLDFMIIGALLVALAYFAWQHDWSGERRGDEAAAVAARDDAVTSIAVLPFVNMSGDPENEYFSEGISEEILNVLVRVEGLRVPSRTSSFAFKDREVNLATIARELKVDHVVEGSVRKSGERVRITAQLIDVATDSHLWSESYERELKDIFVIQKDISASIVEALQAALGAEPLPMAEDDARLTDDVAAYEAYLQGKYFLHNRGQLRGEGLAQAVEWFQAAIERDPRFAAAWAGLGAAQVLYPSYAGIDRAAGEARGEEALSKAIELDPENGAAYAALGLLRVGQFRWIEADRAFSEGLRVDPGFENTYLWYGIFLTHAGKSERAQDMLLQASDKNPLSDIGAHWLADVYRNLGDGDKSLAEARRSLELGMGASELQVYLYHLDQRDWPRAEASLEAYSASFSVDDAWVKPLIEAVRDPQTIPTFHETIQRVLPEDRTFFHGWMYFDLDDPDLVIDVMRDHARDGDLLTLLYRAWEPQFTELRNHPRFAALMEEIGLMDYWRETGWPDLCQASTNTMVCN